MFMEFLLNQLLLFAQRFGRSERVGRRKENTCLYLKETECRTYSRLPNKLVCFRHKSYLGIRISDPVRPERTTSNFRGFGNERGVQPGVSQMAFSTLCSSISRRRHFRAPDRPFSISVWKMVRLYIVKHCVSSYAALRWLRVLRKQFNLIW